MPLINCPYCGKRISDAAPACIHCGGSLGPAGVQGPPRPAGTSPLTVVLIVVGVVFGGVMLIGILAAIAIPRFASVSLAAKEAEAGPVLRQVHALEQGFREQSGAFTADLERIGWTEPAMRYYTISVVEASDSGLCIEATPVPGVGDRLAVQSIGEEGRLYRAPGCVESAEEAEGWNDLPTEAGWDSGAAGEPPAGPKPPKP